MKRYSYRPRSDPESRFWNRVSKERDCWIWTAGRDRDGYGVFNLPPPADEAKKVWIYAHRFVWLMAHGPIPDGLQVLHHCDNPSCVRVSHLFLGTNRDNVMDRVRKMRGGTKLTKAEVRAILADNRASPAVALAYGVSHELIQRIRRGECWRHVYLAIRGGIEASA